ncbi:hypothetical protein MYAM1_000911 [Malassezia yamatoensis]|uniref:Uncharacterized protein n=1 Tax=Malassezia yamatoensis TaxID=253288 RepID=A0AAJ6CFC7_9BASI|nr:hypothetical protein MYAM1_000911 [Malassezia yamatoensis]
MPSHKRGDKMRNAATQEALRSPMRYRHGAVVTKGGKILAQGHNHIRTGFSGPLSAHETILLPGRAASASTCCSDAPESSSGSARGSFSSSYFSMHAEMHAIYSTLRGARPYVARSNVQLSALPEDDQVNDMTQQAADLAIDSRRSASPNSVRSRLSDASNVHRANVGNIKTKCDRALVEGAKREQQRIAFTAQNEWCLKPRYKKRIEEKPPPRPRFTSCRAWEFQQRRAERIARRKQEKRERKARGLRAASSSGSCSSDSSESFAACSSESSLDQCSSCIPAEDDHETDTEVNSLAASIASATLAYRKVRPSSRPREDAIDSRLRGADLYVVRLLQDVESKAKAKEHRRRHLRSGTTAVPNASSNVAPRYADSRPCWRCLEWMLWAGIKRVYWTNADGDWNGGKVASLLFGPEDALTTTSSGAVLVPPAGMYWVQLESKQAVGSRSLSQAIGIPYVAVILGDRYSQLAALDAQRLFPMLRRDSDSGTGQDDQRVPYNPLYPSAFSGHTGQGSGSSPMTRNISGPIALDDFSADEDDAQSASFSAPTYSLQQQQRSQSRLYSPMRARPANNQAASTSHFIVLIPPSDLPFDSLPARSALLASHARRGILLPLYPTLGGQLYALAREYGMPSVGGISFYLLDDGNGHSGPRVSDATWASLWSGFFEDDDLDEPSQSMRTSEAEAISRPSPLPYARRFTPTSPRRRLPRVPSNASISSMRSPSAATYALETGRLPIVARFEWAVDPQRARWWSSFIGQASDDSTQDRSEPMSAPLPMRHTSGNAPRPLRLNSQMSPPSAQRSTTRDTSQFSGNPKKESQSADVFGSVPVSSSSSSDRMHSNSTVPTTSSSIPSLLTRKSGDMQSRADTDLDANYDAKEKPLETEQNQRSSSFMQQDFPSEQGSLGNESVRQLPVTSQAGTGTDSVQDASSSNDLKRQSDSSQQASSHPHNTVSSTVASLSAAASRFFGGRSNDDKDSARSSPAMISSEKPTGDDLEKPQTPTSPIHDLETARERVTEMERHSAQARRHAHRASVEVPRSVRRASARISEVVGKSDKQQTSAVPPNTAGSSQGGNQNDYGQTTSYNDNPETNYEDISSSTPANSGPTRFTPSRTNAGIDRPSIGHHSVARKSITRPPLRTVEGDIFDSSAKFNESRENNIPTTQAQSRLGHQSHPSLRSPIILDANLPESRTGATLEPKTEPAQLTRQSSIEFDNTLGDLQRALELLSPKREKRTSPATRANTNLLTSSSPQSSRQAPGLQTQPVSLLFPNYDVSSSSMQADSGASILPPKQAFNMYSTSFQDPQRPPMTQPEMPMQSIPPTSDTAGLSNESNQFMGQRRPSFDASWQLKQPLPDTSSDKPFNDPQERKFGGHNVLGDLAAPMNDSTSNLHSQSVPPALPPKDLNAESSYAGQGPRNPAILAHEGLAPRTEDDWSKWSAGSDSVLNQGRRPSEASSVMPAPAPALRVVEDAENYIPESSVRMSADVNQYTRIQQREQIRQHQQNESMDETRSTAPDQSVGMQSGTAPMNSTMNLPPSVAPSNDIASDGKPMQGSQASIPGETQSGSVANSGTNTGASGILPPTLAMQAAHHTPQQTIPSDSSNAMNDMSLQREQPAPHPVSTDGFNDSQMHQFKPEFTSNTMSQPMMEAGEYQGNQSAQSEFPQNMQGDDDYNSLMPNNLPQFPPSSNELPPQSGRATPPSEPRTMSVMSPMSPNVSKQSSGFSLTSRSPRILHHSASSDRLQTSPPGGGGARGFLSKVSPKFKWGRKKKGSEDRKAASVSAPLAARPLPPSDELKEQDPSRFSNTSVSSVSRGNNIRRSGAPYFDPTTLVGSPNLGGGSSQGETTQFGDHNSSNPLFPMGSASASVPTLPLQHSPSNASLSQLRSPFAEAEGKSDAENSGMSGWNNTLGSMSADMQHGPTPLFNENVAGAAQYNPETPSLPPQQSFTPTNAAGVMRDSPSEPRAENNLGLNAPSSMQPGQNGSLSQSQSGPNSAPTQYGSGVIHPVNFGQNSVPSVTSGIASGANAQGMSQAVMQSNHATANTPSSSQYWPNVSQGNSVPQPMNTSGYDPRSAPNPTSASQATDFSNSQPPRNLEMNVGNFAGLNMGNGSEGMPGNGLGFSNGNAIMSHDNSGRMPFPAANASYDQEQQAQQPNMMQHVGQFGPQAVQNMSSVGSNTVQSFGHGIQGVGNTAGNTANSLSDNLGGYAQQGTNTLHGAFRR